MPITREIRTLSRINDPCKFDLSQLSASERLFLWRHRQKSINGRLLGRNGAAMSQAEAATALGIDRGTFAKLENGLRTRLSVEEVESLLTALGPLRPTPGELCFVARRRSGCLLSTLERKVKVSRPRYHELERGGDPVVVAMLVGLGFRFPG